MESFSTIMFFYLTVGIKMPEYLREMWRGGRWVLGALLMDVCVFSPSWWHWIIAFVCDSGIGKGVGEEARGISIPRLKC